MYNRHSISTSKGSQRLLEETLCHKMRGPKRKREILLLHFLAQDQAKMSCNI